VANNRDKDDEMSYYNYQLSSLYTDIPIPRSLNESNRGLIPHRFQRGEIICASHGRGCVNSEIQGLKKIWQYESGGRRANKIQHVCISADADMESPKV